MAQTYLKQNFGNQSQIAHKAEGQYRLLLFDEHNSHVNPDFLEFCLSEKIILYCLPPHTTHRLQPLDVSVFRPYKHHYQKELTRRFERHEYGISKANFYEVLMTAHRAAFLVLNIQSRFCITGLYPTNRSIIIQKIQTLQTRPSTSSSTNCAINRNPSSHPILSRSPSPQPLRSFTAQEIHHLEVSRDRQNIQKQELKVFATLPGNDPVAWGLKRIVSNLATSTNRALTTIDDKDRQIENLRKLLAETQK